MLSPTATKQVEEHYNHMNRNMQRMQLQNISENNELYNDEQQRNNNNNNPKANILSLMQHVSDEELRQAIQIEFKRIVTDYDRLISVLQQRSDVIEQEYENLQAIENNYQRRYEKAVREMQFFKKKYEKAAELNKQFLSHNRPRSPSMDSNSSSLLENNRIMTSANYNQLVAGTTSVPISPPPSSSQSGFSEGGMPYSYSSPYPLLPPLLSLINHQPLSESTKSKHLSRSSSSSTSSSTTSGSPYWINGYPSEQQTPVPRLRQNSNATTATGGFAGSIHSSSTEGGDNMIKYTQGRKGSWQNNTSSSPLIISSSQAPLPSSSSPPPPPPSTLPPPSTTLPPHPSVSRSMTNASQQTGYINTSIIQQRKVDPLSFGGSDAFWETIAKSKDTDINSPIEKMISNFLRRGGSPNTAKQSSSHKIVKYGYGLIHTAIIMKAMSTLELLLQHGANPNAMTLSHVEEDKVTPGYLAASMGWLPGLQALTEAGADLTISRGSGLKNKTALHIAAEHCHTTVVEYIVSLTPSKYHFQVDSMGANTLHYACASGHTDLVAYLIQNCQLPIDQTDIRGETPLHWASRQGHLEVASFLIERCGCNFNSYIPRKIGTPYDFAKSGGHKRLLEYYKKVGALASKKLDKKREEEIAQNVPIHLESALARNGLFNI